MKSRLIIYIGITLLFSACTKKIGDETENPCPPLSFKVELRWDDATALNTKAPSGLVTEFTKGESFGLFTCKTTNRWEVDSVLATTNFMYNQQVTFDGNNYIYSPLKYFPEDGSRLSFFGYYPYITTGGSAYGIELPSTNAKGTPQLKFTIKDDISQQVDLLYTAALNMTSSQIIPEGNVKLVFRHALTQIKFSAKLVSDLVNATNYEVTINSVKFNNIKKTGFLYMANGTWRNWSNNASFTAINSTIPLTSSTPKYLQEKPLIMIPQPLDGATLEVQYTIIDPLKRKQVKTKSIYLSAPWGAGKVLNYELTIDLESFEIFITQKIEDWIPVPGLPIGEV